MREGKGAEEARKHKKKKFSTKTQASRRKRKKQKSKKMRLFGLLCPAGGYSAGWALCLMFIFAEFLVVLLIFSTCGTAGGFWGLLGSLGSLIGVFFGRISGVVLFFLVVPGVLPDRFFCLAPCSLARAIFRRGGAGGCLDLLGRLGSVIGVFLVETPGWSFFVSSTWGATEKSIFFSLAPALWRVRFFLRCCCAECVKTRKTKLKSLSPPYSRYKNAKMQHPTPVLLTKIQKCKIPTFLIFFFSALQLIFPIQYTKNTKMLPLQGRPRRAHVPTDAEPV